MQYVAVCSRPSRAFFKNSVAIVAIIWKLVFVRIAQLFCGERSDHMETNGNQPLTDNSNHCEERTVHVNDRTFTEISDFRSPYGALSFS